MKPGVVLVFVALFCWSNVSLAQTITRRSSTIGQSCTWNAYEDDLYDVGFSLSYGLSNYGSWRVSGYCSVDTIPGVFEVSDIDHVTVYGIPNSACLYLYLCYIHAGTSSYFCGSTTSACGLGFGNMDVYPPSGTYTEKYIALLLIKVPPKMGIYISRVKSWRIYE